MSAERREFLRTLAVAAAAGLPLGRALAAESPATADFYRLPAPPPGTVSLLHFTDCHAQLEPGWLRESDRETAAVAGRGRRSQRVDEALLREAGIVPGTAIAHALSSLDFVESARRFGPTGGFAHLATLIHQLRAERPGALLLDGGDSWQGSALALWTEGAVMMEACQALGVDAMTAHWEFTLGQARVQQALAGELAGRIAFLARNVVTREFNDPVFQPVLRRVIQGVPVAVIGQAYPYTTIAHPPRLVPDWSFGLQEAALQADIQAERAAGAQVVVLLSHNGVDIDLKLASRVSGLDAILGGHTHAPLPQGVRVANPGGSTLVTNAGSHGKFLGVLDIQLASGRVRQLDYRLLPVFSRLLPADPVMAGLLARQRAPWRVRLEQPLARTEGLLYRRGTFGGSFDALILKALMDVRGAEIALSPGFRWGTTVLPGETITREHLMEQTAISYPETTLRQLKGSAIKDLLEDVADNLFHPDPYYRQGGDMVRVGGLRYRCTPGAPSGQRISELRLGGRPLAPDRVYRVAGWASMADPVPGESGPPIWEVVETWLAQQAGPLPPFRPDSPTLDGAVDAGARVAAAPSLGKN